jgi:TonB family protein
VQVPVGNIKIVGLPDEERDQLLSKLPVRVGDTPTVGAFSELMTTVHQFDEHLTVVSSRPEGAAEQEIDIRLAGTPVSPTPAAQSANLLPPPVGAVKLGANVAAANIVTKVVPTYPELAKAAGVQGDVQFQALIGTDGTVQNLHLLSGPPLLVQAAMKAVQQWVYKPTLLNGQPVQVSTTIDVNFSLSQ